LTFKETIVERYAKYTMRKLCLGLCAMTAIALAAPATAADDNPGVKVGILTCNTSSGWGLVFGSSRQVRCVFDQDGNRTEHYTGRIAKFGVDVGYTKAGILVWTVLAPASNLAPGALAGEYGGATATAAVAAGPSANVLVGGLHRSVSLQPVSIGGATGLNIAAGVEGLRLVKAAPIS
jgi:hypothetical protein